MLELIVIVFLLAIIVVMYAEMNSIKDHMDILYTENFSLLEGLNESQNNVVKLKREIESLERIIYDDHRYRGISYMK